MEDSWKGVVYILGLIIVIYIVLNYVLPLLLKGITFILTVVMWAAIIFLVIMLVGYVMKLLKNQ